MLIGTFTWNIYSILSCLLRRKRSTRSPTWRCFGRLQAFLNALHLLSHSSIASILRRSSRGFSCAHAGPEIQVGVWERRRFSCRISTCFWALSGHLRSAAGCKAGNGGLAKRLRDMLVLNMCISCHLGAACFIQLATTAPRQPLSDCSTSATLVVTRAHFSSRTRAHTTWWPTECITCRGQDELGRSMPVARTTCCSS